MNDEYAHGHADGVEAGRTAISILGSTGSIGRQTLEVVSFLSDRFRVIGLSGRSNLRVLASQVEKYRPRVVGIESPDQTDDFIRLLKEKGLNPDEYPELVYGNEGMTAIATLPEVEQVMVAVVGIAALVPVLSALEAGKRVALANKECLVTAGHLVMEASKRSGGRIVPVDSELSAIFQCWRAGSGRQVKRVILTASGGPFFDLDKEALKNVTPAEALRHPTWRMGKRITVDSATLMNKGFEVMETRWLFGLSVDRIDVLIHPESVIHSIVEFEDGSQVAQLGTPDMRLPIQYALTYPDRYKSLVDPLDLALVGRLTFKPVDLERFPCLRIAYDASKGISTLPAVINGADEVLVDEFLSGRIGFTDIPRIISMVAAEHKPKEEPSLEEILRADTWARERALRAVTG
ncbi:MAG TPA: 1-deoxy-D-xylulose-5-phosphate reductoisomerase [Clostridia bacterium]|nr:1-deoxy-D-xylulose-5-phosphate reductoisomerase [Clostridia bacterium]